MVSILEEAAELVNGERQAAYGEPVESMRHIAAVWSALLGHDITGEDVALCLTAMKLVRQKASPKRDNLVDAAGYLEIAARMMGVAHVEFSMPPEAPLAGRFFRTLASEDWTVVGGNVRPGLHSGPGAVFLSQVHPAGTCLTDRCWIHSPTEHPMRDFPIRMRGPQAPERICLHEVGHPDPDWLHGRVEAVDEIHGCDGCCDGPLKVGDLAVVVAGRARALPFDLPAGTLAEVLQAADSDGDVYVQLPGGPRRRRHVATALLVRHPG